MILSVCVIAYNHAKFITSCLDGIIKQDCNFDFEIVIGDDCSVDKTQEICELYKQKYPDLITYNRRKENLGMYGNWIKTLSECKGKYIAVCEGDDYWTDPFKLQKQVDFLETHTDYEVCFTNVEIINDVGAIVKKQLMKDSIRDVFEMHNLPNWAPTLTRVFRNRDFNAVPKAPGLDSVMLLWQSRYGKIKFLKQITGTYRLHQGGVYSSLDKTKQVEQMIDTTLVSLTLLDTPEILSKYFGTLFKRLIELKSLEINLYKDKKGKVKKVIKEYAMLLPASLRIKVRFSLVMLNIPLLYHFSFFKRLSKKIINRLFVYRNLRSIN